MGYDLNTVRGDGYYRWSIWTTAMARRLMLEAGVPDNLIGKFRHNEGDLVNPGECLFLAKTLAEFAGLPIEKGKVELPPEEEFSGGPRRVLQALGKGDLPTDFE